MKKFKNLISIVLLIFGICFIFPNIAFSLDYENGHFEKINTDFPIIGQPIKLNDGRILIISGTEIINFNPKTSNCNLTTGLICTDTLIILDSPLCEGVFRSEN